MRTTNQIDFMPFAEGIDNLLVELVADTGSLSVQPSICRRLFDLVGGRNDYSPSAGSAHSKSHISPNSGTSSGL